MKRNDIIVRQEFVCGVIPWNETRGCTLWSGYIFCKEEVNVESKCRGVWSAVVGSWDRLGQRNVWQKKRPGNSVASQRCHTPPRRRLMVLVQTRDQLSGTFWQRYDRTSLPIFSSRTISGETIANRKLIKNFQLELYCYILWEWLTNSASEF